MRNTDSKERQISRGEFVRLGALLGLGSAVASTVACGGGSAGGDTGETQTGGSSEKVASGGPEVGKGQVIASVSEVSPGDAFPFTDTDSGMQSVLVRLPDGEFAAYSAVCTHQRCIVAYRPDSRKLVCPCHGSVFDAADGAAVENGPATQPLPEVEIDVRDDRVYLA